MSGGSSVSLGVGVVLRLHHLAVGVLALAVGRLALVHGGLLRRLALAVALVVLVAGFGLARPRRRPRRWSGWSGASERSSPIFRSRMMARAMRAKAFWSSTASVSLSRSAPALASISSRNRSTSGWAMAGGFSPVSRSRTIRPTTSASGGLASGLDLVERRLRPGLLQHRLQVLAHAAQGIGADRLDARLLDGVVDRLRPAREAGRRLGVGGGVVVGEAQRHLVGEAADARGVDRRSGRAADAAARRGCRTAAAPRRR